MIPYYVIAMKKRFSKKYEVFSSYVPIYFSKVKVLLRVKYKGTIMYSYFVLYRKALRIST